MGYSVIAVPLSYAMDTPPPTGVPYIGGVYKCKFTNVNSSSMCAMKAGRGIGCMCVSWKLAGVWVA